MANDLIFFNAVIIANFLSDIDTSPRSVVPVADVSSLLIKRLDNI